MKTSHAVIFASAFLMSASAFAIEGQSSTVNFSGQIRGSSCELASTSQNQNILLGDVSANALATQGATSSPVDFKFELTGCQPAIAETAKVTFSGDTAADTALKTSDGDNTKVGIQILQGGTPLVLNGSEASTGQTLVSGANTMAFSARYVALENGVVPGEANATASFTLSYE